MKAQVAIITPAYNHEKYISFAIESVLAQTYQKWIMIIVDDGSTDSTLEIAQDYSKKDERIVVLTQDNVGLDNLHKTYNLALSKAKTAKYVSILEGDDYWDQKKIEVYVDIMEAESSVMCYGICKTVDEGNTVIDYYPRKHIWENVNVKNSPVGSFLNNYLKSSFIPTPTLMFRRNELEKIGGFQQPIGMKVVDYPTILDFALLGSFSFVKDKLAYYRIHANQATAGSEINAASAGELALQFYDNLSGEIKNQLALTRKELEKNIEFREYLNYFHRGRILLINKNFVDAKQQFLKLLKSAIFSIKIRGIMGLLGAILHFDIEIFAKLIGRRKLS